MVTPGSKEETEETHWYSLWPVASWEAETLESSESIGGETVGLQRAGGEAHAEERQRERPMMQLARNREKGHDSEEDWRWVDLAPGSWQQTSRLAGDLHGGLSPAGGTPRVCKAEL